MTEFQPGWYHVQNEMGNAIDCRDNINTLKNRGYRLLQAISIGLLITTLVGCNGEEPDKGPATASIIGYNNTEDYIHRFFVDESWGGNIRAYSGGGGSCAVSTIPVNGAPILPPQCVGVPRVPFQMALLALHGMRKLCRLSHSTN